MVGSRNIATQFSWASPRGNIDTSHQSTAPQERIHSTPTSRHAYPYAKRSLDTIGAIIALIITMPAFIIIPLLLRMNGGTALFCQPRIGRHGKIFMCYKFRTMHLGAEASLTTYLKNDPIAAHEWQKFQKIKNDARVTNFGRFLRRTSLDELPQLLNVIRGEMSLVGPRPILPEQQKLYGNYFKYYIAARPGITGPWQVMGRNRLSFKERVIIETWYVKTQSMRRDIQILFKTIPALIRQESA